MMGKILELYRNFKIKRKIQLFSAVLMSILILIFTLFADSIAQDIIIKRSVKTTENKMNDIQKYFEEMEKDIFYRLHYLKTSISFQLVLKEATTSEHSAVETGTINAILNDTVNKSYVNDIDVFDINGRCIACSDSSKDNNSVDNLSVDIMNQIMEADESGYWYDNTISNSAYTENLVVYYMVKDREGNTIGYISANLSSTKMIDIYNYLGFNQVAEIYLFSEKENIYLPKESSIDNLIIARRSIDDYTNGNLKRSPIREYQGKEYYVISRDMSKYHMYIFAIIPYSLLLEDINLIRVIVWLMGGIFFGLQLIFALLLSKSISVPIVNLALKMQQIGNGDLTLRFRSNRKDEIGILSQNIDFMVDKIVALMKEQENAQRQKRKLELISLQNQITPHFLYNSLEGISALCQMDEADVAFHMSKSLSMFYKGALSKGRVLISLQEELNIAKSYLEVQQIRYKDVFTYEMFVDENILNTCIAKLTIQPFIENAIYHGLKNVRYKGYIHIFGEKTDGKVLITIKDNGKGFSSEEQSMKPEDEKSVIKSSGFGMKNVDQRLKLYFGDDYGVFVNSVENEGTCIKIWIPDIKYEENGDDFSSNSR